MGGALLLARSGRSSPQPAPPTHIWVVQPHHLTTCRAGTIRGDAARSLRLFGDNHFSAIVTDPPYGLSKQPDTAAVLTAWLSTERHEHGASGFMGHDWDSFVPGPDVWRECIRVLKPGGHMLVFAGSRTQDLMGIAVRLAGFEVRDTIMWVYGQGFPKSLDVGKTIDQAGGKDAQRSAERLKSWREAAGMSRSDLAELVGCSEASIRDWEEGRSRKRGLPPEYLVPPPQYRQRLNELCSYGTDERQVVGTASARTGDQTIYGLGHAGRIYGEVSTEMAGVWEGWGTSLKPAYEPILVCRKPIDGTVTNNVLAHGTGAVNIGASRIGDEPVKINTFDSGARPFGGAAGEDYTTKLGSGRFPANLMFTHHPDCDELGVKEVRSNGHHPSSRPKGGLGTSGHGGQTGLVERGARSEMSEEWACHPACPVGQADAQSDPVHASRFFYCAKASKAERNTGMPDGSHNTHPTVKPVKLMEYLVRLVTPPGGTVLDPFCGSGTTLVAAENLGFDSVGIDRDDDNIYLDIARNRVEAASHQPEPDTVRP